MGSANSVELLFGQTEILLTQEFDPETFRFNIASLVEIHGSVDPVIFERAIRHSLGEAEALTMHLADSGGEFLQTRNGLQDSEFVMVHHDVREDSRASDTVKRWTEAGYNRPSTLDLSPPVISALFKMPDGRDLWYFRCHHARLDVYGVTLYQQRVADVYSTLCRDGQPGPNPFGSLQSLIDEFKEYRQADMAEDRSFWIRHLSDQLDPLSFSVRPESLEKRDLTTERPTRQHKFGGHVDGGVRHRLQEIGRAGGDGWHTAVIAATAIYTHRLTGAQYITLGMPLTGRSTPLARRVPAMLANVLPFRLEIRPDADIKNIVTQVSRELANMLQHQRYRAEDLRRDLGLQGTERRLFGPVVNIMPAPSALTFDGMGSTVSYLAGSEADDIAVYAYPDQQNDGFSIGIAGNPRFYSADEVESHLHHLIALLGSMATNSVEAPSSRLDLLTCDEFDDIITRRNETSLDGSLESFPELFEAQCCRTPGVSAVVGASGEVTYAELRQRAVHLGRLLRSRGIGPEDVVAILLERSEEFIVAMLAVLGIGAAYLPLSPMYPEDQLHFILGDAAARLTITRRLHESKVVGQVLILEDINDQCVQEDTGADGCVSPHPDSAAYMIYTSGSTGRPKGVVVSHRALGNSLLLMKLRHRVAQAANDTVPVAALFEHPRP